MKPLRPNSLWLDGLEAPAFGALTDDVRHDVIVVGGGIAGVLAAERIAAGGADVAVVESRQIGRGVTGNTTGKVSALQQTMLSKISDARGSDAARAYADASHAGLKLIADLVADHKIECGWERTDAWTFAEDQSQTAAIETEFIAAAAAGLPVSTEVETGLPVESWGAVRLADQAQFNASAFTIGLAEAVSGNGVTVYEHAQITKLSETRNGVRLETGAFSLVADRVVIATSFPFADRGLYFARLNPQRSYCIALEIDGEVPEGMFISAGSKTRSLRAVDAPDGSGRRLIVGGEGHRVGEDEPPDRYEALARWARQHFDVKSITHAWSSQDNMTFDHLPMVGPLRPLSGKVHVITGFNKWGLATAGAAAVEIEARLRGEPGPWQSVFDSQRKVPRELREVLHAGWKFTEHLVTDELKHRSAPRCTHLGCRLIWNDAEKSWDCPCHGSRFSSAGKVLQGPATKDIAELAAIGEEEAAG